MPGETWTAMETNDPLKNVALVAIGYKYSRKKVLFFAMTRGAGSTKASMNDPYIVRFMKEQVIMEERKVARPDIIAKCFRGSNVNDTHNHVRQAELALEDKWETCNP
jgi:hypothetical protein